jgi:hypothetical protein
MVFQPPAGVIGQMDEMDMVLSTEIAVPTGHTSVPGKTGVLTLGWEFEQLF